MEAIERAFNLIGSRAMITDLAQWLDIDRAVRRVIPGYTRVITIDVARDRKGEFFRIGLDPVVRVRVMSMDKTLKHLLLFAVDGEGKKYRYLCGHDERHWFAAAVAGGVSNVDDAIESLKPDEVIEAQAGLRRKERNRRRNKATLRQGEWFFIPVPEMVVDPALIIRNEPVRRGRGSAHMVEELYRRGGSTVFVCRKYPAGITEHRYNNILVKNPDARFWDWRTMRRDMDVFGRGKVTHRDHRTITLSGWHRILVNTEAEAWFMAKTLVFLD